MDADFIIYLKMQNYIKLNTFQLSSEVILPYFKTDKRGGVRELKLPEK